MRRRSRPGRPHRRGRGTARHYAGLQQVLRAQWVSARCGVRSELTGPSEIHPTGYAIKMVTVKTEISAGGDLGYAVGTYEQTAPDKSGVLTHSVGKWMSVFRKQPDGSWGAIADTPNVDPST